ncbi:MAG: DUF1697 domain-containing protein [Trueperaceae bacterium]
MSDIAFSSFESFLAAGGHDSGCVDVSTYIQSGNVLFSKRADREELERELEQALERRLDLQVPTIVRSAEEWSGYIAGNSFPQESLAQPNLVMLALSKSAPRVDAKEGLLLRAAARERIERVGDALWIYFPNVLHPGTPTVLPPHDS